MATIVRNAKDIYELNCRMCNGIFKSPKVFPCLHSFCQPCLQELVSANDRAIICPTCHIDVIIPTKGIDSFPSNTFISNMINIIAVQNPTNCTNCEESTELATSRCLDCVENLCNSCVTAHERIRQTKYHKIITFDELQNNALGDAIKTPSFCKEHEREILKYYCQSCDDAVCRDCALYEHRDHHYLDLIEAVKKNRNGINELLDTSKRNIPVIKLAIKELSEVEEDLKRRKAYIAEKIHEAINENMKQLEEKREVLLEQLQHMYINKEAVLKEQHLGLEMDLHNFVSSTEFVEHMMVFGNEAEIMTVKQMMKTRLDQLNNAKLQLEPEENDVIDFFPADKPLKDAIGNCGVLTTTEIFPPYCTVSGVGVVEATVGYLTNFYVKAKNRLNEPTNKGGDDVSVKLIDADGFTIDADVEDMSHGIYKVFYTVKKKGKHNISVDIRGKPIQGSPFELNVIAGVEIDKIGPLLTQFGSGGIIKNVRNDDSYEPWGVTCTIKGEIIVSDHNNHKIQIYDMNGKFLFNFGTRGKLDGEIWYPTGVAVDRDENIYVADHGNHRIQIYSKNGKFIRKFGVRGTGDGQLKGPCGLAITSEGRLVVADRDNNRIQVFNSQGSYLYQFGGYGSADGKFNSPRDVAVTTDDQILVTDSNNYRIQRFDKVGRFFCKFGTKGTQDGQLMCPSGLDTDCESNIVVADFKNINVQLFDCSGNFLKKLDISEIKESKHLLKPTGVCITTQGNVLVADRGTHRLLIY